MGQYYRIVTRNRKDGLIVNNRKYKGSPDISAKLTEHSYLENYMTSSVAFYIENNPTRVMWVGDYAENCDLRRITNHHVSTKDVWREGFYPEHEFKFKGKFDHKGKFLVNHTKKRYLSYDDYVALSGGRAAFNYTFDPLPLLTAVGNGLGGGDYHGENEDKIGLWAYDKLEITGKKPEGYRKFMVSFAEKGLSNGN